MLPRLQIVMATHGSSTAAASASTGTVTTTPTAAGDGIPVDGDGDIDTSGPLLGLLEDLGKKNSIEVGDGHGDIDAAPWLSLLRL